MSNSCRCWHVCITHVLQPLFAFWMKSEHYDFFCKWLEFQTGYVLSLNSKHCFSLGNSVKMPRMTQRYATITMNNDSKRCIILTIYTCSSTKLDPVTWLKKKITRICAYWICHNCSDPCCCAGDVVFALNCIIWKP